MSAAERLEKKLVSLVETAAKALVLEITKELIATTPLDTGHAKTNWIPSIARPYGAVAEGKAAQRAGIASVTAYRIGDGLLYVSNHVPYIRFLNDGSSSQAPSLFVEAAIDRAMVTIKRTLGVDFGRSEFQSRAGSRGAENMAAAYSPFGDDD